MSDVSRDSGLDERIRRWLVADEFASASPVLDAAFAQIVHVRQQRRWPWSELAEALGQPASLRLPRWAWVVVVLMLAGLLAVAFIAGADRLRPLLDRLTALPATAAQLTVASCPAELLSAADVVCSTATVPRRHGDPPAGTLSLSVTEYGPRAAPGVGGQDAVPILVIDLPDPFGEQTRVDFDRIARADRRQIISVAPRGTAPGDETVACPELEAAANPSAWLADGGVQTAVASAVAACRDRQAAAGVDLAAFEPIEMAADLESVRLSLGVDRWIVRARGREAMLALELARRYPASVSGVVLVNPMLPGEDTQRSSFDGLDAALAELSRMCAADAFCATRYTLPSEAFAALDETLGAGGVPVSVRDASGVDVIVKVEPELLRAAVRDALARTPSIGTLPARLDGAAAGDLEWLAQALIDRGWCLGSELRCSLETGWSGGAELSMGCAAGEASDPWLLICPAWLGAGKGQSAGASGIQVPIVAIVGTVGPWTSEPRVRAALQEVPDAAIVVAPWAPEGFEFQCLQASGPSWYATADRAASFTCPDVALPVFADAP